VANFRETSWGTIRLSAAKLSNRLTKRWTTRIDVGKSSVRGVLAPTRRELGFERAQERFRRRGRNGKAQQLSEIQVDFRRFSAKRLAIPRRDPLKLRRSGNPTIHTHLRRKMATGRINGPALQHLVGEFLSSGSSDPCAHRHQSCTVGHCKIFPERRGRCTHVSQCSMNTDA